MSQSLQCSNRSDAPFYMTTDKAQSRGIWRSVQDVRLTKYRVGLAFAIPGDGSNPAPPLNNIPKKLQVLYSDIFHLIQELAIAFFLHRVAMDKPQAGRVDAVAQTALITRPVCENMT